MKRTWSTLGPALLLLIVVLSGCSQAAAPLPPTSQPTAAPTAIEALPDPTPTEAPVEAKATDTPTPDPTATITDAGPEEVDELNAAFVVWAADGTITEGEYDQQLDFGDIRLWWRNDAEALYLALEGDTAGWVAVGLNPQNGMEGADYIFGYVADGTAQVWDAWGTAPRGANHPPDEDLGGTNDIAAFVGVEEGGLTRLEVQKSLASGDAYDQTLEPGRTYPIIVAIGGEDEFNAYHLRYDRGELTLTPAP